MMNHVHCLLEGHKCTAKSAWYVGLSVYSPLGEGIAVLSCSASIKSTCQKLQLAPIAENINAP